MAKVITSSEEIPGLRGLQPIDAVRATPEVRAVLERDFFLSGPRRAAEIFVARVIPWIERCRTGRRSSVLETGAFRRGRSG